MIASLRGAVLHAGLDHAVIEVGGVGLNVHLTPRTAGGLRAGQEATVATTLVVREESLTLYGFAEIDERNLFEQVQTVSGVGPRLALAMLSVLSPEEVLGAVSGGDLLTLTKVPGIGKKGAERIVLELRDKVLPIGAGVPEAPAAASAHHGISDQQAADVRDALVGLGWSAKQAEDALARIAKAGDPPDELPALLRAALRELGR